VVSTARARNKLLVVEGDGTVRLGTFKDKVVHWLKNRNLDERSRANNWTTRIGVWPMRLQIALALFVPFLS